MTFTKIESIIILSKSRGFFSGNTAILGSKKNDSGIDTS